MDGSTVETTASPLWAPRGSQDALALVQSFGVATLLQPACGDGGLLEALSSVVDQANGCDTRSSAPLTDRLAARPSMSFHPVSAALDLPPIQVDLVISDRFFERLPAGERTAALKALDTRAPRACHLVTCALEDRAGSGPSLTDWATWFFGVDAAYVLARVDLLDGPPGRVAALFMKGHPAFEGGSLAEELGGAETLLDLGLNQAAEALVRRRLHQGRREERAYLSIALGNILLEQEDPRPALAFFHQLTFDFKDEPLVYVNQCGALLRAGKPHLAKAWARAAGRLFPGNPDVAQLPELSPAPVQPASPPVLWLDRYDAWEESVRSHAGHAFSTHTLRAIEAFLPERMERTVETGCGKSTILFSNLSERHKVFALDDRSLGAKSSVVFFHDCPLSRPDRVEWVFGPTQLTLPPHAGHQPYDAILIDGPHGYPFPELEYLFLYPHLKPGGILILDDVIIPTIGRLADFIVEDAMFEPLALIEGTALFRRTDAPTFDPLGDGWWAQRYNQRRVSPRRDFYLHDQPVADFYTPLKLDERLYSR